MFTNYSIINRFVDNLQISEGHFYYLSSEKGDWHLKPSNRAEFDNDSVQKSPKVPVTCLIAELRLSGN
jgi:hypothetical protein